MKFMLLSIALSAILSHAAFADSEPLVFESAEQEARFNELTAELRCLVCQNQTLADSDAELAADLRQEIFGMMQAGRSDAEIKTFLVDRYGDFVLYRPPVQTNTLALWLMPFLLLFIGGLVVVFAVRKRRARGAGEDQA